MKNADPESKQELEILIEQLKNLDKLEKFIMKQREKIGNVHGSAFTAKIKQKQREACCEKMEQFEKSAEFPLDEIACQNWCKGLTSAPGSEVGWEHEESKRVTQKRKRALSAARKKLLEKERAQQNNV
jgi:hypothetical protein